MDAPGIKGRDMEYPTLSTTLRIIISIACGIQVISVIYIYSKSFEMSKEITTSKKEKSKSLSFKWLRDLPV